MSTCPVPSLSLILVARPATVSVVADFFVYLQAAKGKVGVAPRAVQKDNDMSLRVCIHAHPVIDAA